ncbi:hypothetical protein ACN3E9_13425 [Vibrio pectenicida]|uniref:hypothetical protein n=1 Tax=Vibrio pectenicida TaxID=62763 RepID=UPI003B9BF495
MTKNNHHIDETEFGLSIGISHLMMEKGEIFYTTTSNHTEHQWPKLFSRLQQVKKNSPHKV